MALRKQKACSQRPEPLVGRIRRAPDRTSSFECAREPTGSLERLRRNPQLTPGVRVGSISKTDRSVGSLLDIHKELSTAHSFLSERCPAFRPKGQNPRL